MLYMPFVNLVAKKIGLNKAILYSSLSSIIGVAGNIITLGLIVSFLSPDEQGYYFTFSSLISIQIFFELGLNGIIVQFIAHDSADLTMNGSRLTGKEQNISRVASLFKFSFLWYLAFSILLLFTLLFFGEYFFSNFSSSDGAVNWKLPWLVISISTFLNLIITPFSAFLIGVGEISLVMRSQMFQQIVKILTLVVSLTVGLKLYSMGISVILAIIPLLYLFFIKRRAYFIFLSKVKIVEKVDYRSEIFPLQWKIALSWISGYFIFQLFNPILFARDGAVMAGKMGITLSVLNSITSIALVWVSTKAPIFSNYIAKGDFLDLDKLFKKSVTQATIVHVVFLFLFFLCFSLLNYFEIKILGKSVGNRFLPIFAILIMAFSLILNLWISSLSIYLRAHKKEPFLVISIVSAIMCSASIIVFGKLFGLYGMTISYFFVTMIITFFAYDIFCKKRRLWHEISNI